MEDNPNVGACQPKIRAYHAKDTFEYAGASGGFLDKNGYPYCRGRVFATVEKDNGQYDSIIPIFWATGATLMVRSQLYIDAGGLDKDFFAHMEEIDLCWRILLKGYQIMVVPQSMVYHLGGGSLPASNPRKTYLNFRNNLLLLHKNLPDSTRNKTLFRRRLLDTIAWAKFVATLDFKNASAVWRAHCDFRHMRKAYTQHPDIDLLKTRSDCRRNILIDYYLKGRKTY
jgi:GT2 family glycosyltransferase